MTSTSDPRTDTHTATDTATASRPGDGTAGASADAFAERLVAAVLGAQLVQAAFLGDRLGWYRALAEAPATAAELANRTGTAERYAREWLEHQAVCGVLTVDACHRFTLPPAHAEVLTDELSQRHALPLARMAGALGCRLDAVAAAYRSGGGVGWAEFGDAAREAQSAANRPLYLGPLARDYLPSVPEVAAVLARGGRIADIGCGHGWSAIGIALAHPDVRVDGYDVDGPSVEAARRNAVEAGVADRVRFHLADAAALDVAVTGHYDLVAAFECVHDLPDPVAVLAAMRRLAGPHGVVVVLDERVADEFSAPGDAVEQLMYGWSLTCCLPDGLSHAGSVGTGTVMRPATLWSYASAAGFAGVETPPLDDAFFRLYVLRAGA